MAKRHRQKKDSESLGYNVSITQGQSHELVKTFKITRLGITLWIITVIVILFTLSSLIIAYTPLKTLIPGYPDPESQQMAITNAVKIDSLESVMRRWEFYAENLRRIVEGEDPVKVDSLVRTTTDPTVIQADANKLYERDSLLRQIVKDEDEFGLSSSRPRQLPIEGMHFFTPIKGVVSQPFVELLHPYIDITAPANTVVTAVLDGTVINSGWTDEGGYTIEIQHEEGIISIYKRNAKLLKRSGDRVKAGAPIALAGSTASATPETHLHFELWYNGESVDPTKYISF